ncbi:hypothetical protein [Halothiobacillus sp. DCM-1]|uniref:hypothetical protein n=1 Tax=Halothiobacillus sp. DCM-1 TaxID=3112558 RepID=UPI00324A4837
MKTALHHELDGLSVAELERLIQSIDAELSQRQRRAARPPDEQEIVQVLSFELKRHRKQKDEVFNPFA